jgi:WD40 repeat protein
LVLSSLARYLLGTPSSLHLLSPSFEVASTYALSDSFSHVTSLASPHTPNSIVSLVGPSLLHVDPRDPNPSSLFPSAHDHGVTCLDFNPNRPAFIATGGKDGHARLWDLRTTKQALEGPALQLSGHSHWLTNVEFNPSHDQLLLTTSSDTTVALSLLSSVSSSPLLALADSPRPPPLDHRVSIHEGHGAPVVGAAWSASDAWCWATADESGEVIVDHVASEEKYKILL